MDELTLVFVLFAALVTPLLLSKFKISFLPTAVAEIIIGIIIGKSLLHIVEPNDILNQLSQLGVIILMFLSGMEIDFGLFVKKPLLESEDQPHSSWKPLKLAIFSYLTILICSFLLAALFCWIGWFSDLFLIGMLFSTIGLGVVIAALKEKEILNSEYGQTILLIAVLGEILPMLALTVYASLYGTGVQRLWMVLLVFLAAAILLRGFKRIFKFFKTISKETTQLDIRLAFFLIITLVVIAESTGAENILGAFVAGMVFKLLNPSEDTFEKLNSIGYGFFIPIFFIMTGVKLNIPSLLADTSTLVLIPIMFIGFMLPKLIGGLFLRFRFRRRNAWAGAFLSATTITLVLATLQVTTALGTLSTGLAGDFTIAAILTCLVSPICFNKLFVADQDTFKKSRVVFLGVNVMSVPVAQQLSRGLYEVKMFTDNAEFFHVYNSEMNVELLEDLNEETLLKHNVFKTDIFISTYRESQTAYELALLAKQHQVKRVIARFETRNVLDERYSNLSKQNVEIISTYDSNITLLRTLIESPSMLKVLNDTEMGLFEVVVKNHNYTGLEIMNLPFIDHITISRIFRKGQVIAPHGYTTIEYDDHILFTGEKNILGDIKHQLEKDN